MTRHTLFKRALAALASVPVLLGVKPSAAEQKLAELDKRCRKTLAELHTLYASGAITKDTRDRAVDKVRQKYRACHLNQSNL